MEEAVLDKIDGGNKLQTLALDKLMAQLLSSAVLTVTLM